MPVSVSALSLVMPSPTTPLSVENEVMRGCGRGGGVDGHVQRARGHPGIAGSISCRGGQAVAAIRQDRRGVAPGPCSARQRAAEQRRTVIDLDRAVGFRRAGKVSALSLVMPSPTTPLSVENEVMRGCGRGCRVDGHVQRARGHPGIAGSISCRGGQAVAAIRQGRRGVAPGPCSARQRAAEQRRAVIDLDRAVGFRRAGERQRIVIGDVVADHAAVGRERGDGRRNRCGGVDGDAQRARGHAGIAGSIGRRGGQAVGAVGQRRRGVAPGPCSARHALPSSVAPSKTLTVRWLPPCRSASAHCHW